MKYPNFLSDNSSIGIPTPSSGARDETKVKKFHQAKLCLTNQNYKVLLSKNLYSNTKGRSASAKERAKEINEMFSSSEIDGILCAAGGDFLLEILPYVDFENIKKHQKLIAGFSDSTGLLYPITTKLDIATVYGSNFSSLGTIPLHKSQNIFLDYLRGNIKEQESYEYYEETPIENSNGLEGYNLTKKVLWKTINEDEITMDGRIIGGCLDIISDLAGTKYDGIIEFNEKYKEDGIIWYFDNCELSMEEVIRTLWKLKELDYFKYANGVIFGRFGIEKTYYDYDVKTCLEDSILKYR